MEQMAIDVGALGKVAVLMGGSSAERPVSLMSGQGVLEALRGQGVDAHAFDPSERDLSDLKREGFERCFIALHGRHGEDGTMQGALEMLGIPYTGSGVMASAIAMDKVMTKRLWQSAGLPVPRGVVLHRGALAVDHLPDELGLPLIVKSAREGSSFGVTRVTEPGQLAAAVALAAQYDSAVVCEECIVGEEVTCAVLGEGAAARSLPVIRIQAPGGNYDFEHKYHSDDTRYLCPSGLPEAEETNIQQLVVQAYRVLGCRGWGRADIMIRARDRQPFLLEMNTSPGMTSHSLVPKSAQAVGLSYEALCLRLLAAATLDTPPRLLA